jgi:hypothetical protein
MTLLLASAVINIWNWDEMVITIIIIIIITLG